ncbi:MAG: hypothetical protein HPPSJP_3690 [Candidatus Hepatoplasma scabrum]|nr:MAG: hypothetical protein HPPSJP_3690 [Candidatus Hepatoplasma sp.]
MKKLNINDVIIKPIITEKNSRLTADHNTYILEVHPNATREDVKRAVEYIFAKSDAKVKKVNIAKVKAKAKKMGRYEGFKKSYKKAYVILSAGAIPIYGAEGVEKDKKESNKKGLKIINTEKLMKEAEKDIK